MQVENLSFRILMEEDGSSSIVSTAKMNIIRLETTSDSFDSNSSFRSSKRPKHDTNVASMKFKGVVPQQNGHWGAQIYANHQRIWLGTFKSEKEAAMAYDSAAIKLRSGDSHRNFPWTDRTIQEPNFQNQFSIEAILSMIRDGSYQPKFADFLRTQSQREENIGTSLSERRVQRDGQFSFIQLFQKELTPSDVGKLNRLVIPKKFAVKYFPYICESVEEEGALGGAGIDDIELMFYDRLMKSWKFRYCYWRSSQSFVFTRGWNRFVKEKNLKEKDIVTFYTCMCPADRVQDGQHFYLIDITYSEGKTCVVDGVHQIEEMQKELELKLGQSLIRTKIIEKDEKDLDSENNVNGHGLRLFGVRIN